MSIGKWTGIAFPAIYLLGLLIHSTHLATYSVYDFNQIGIRYALIGAVFLLVSLASAMVVLVGTNLSKPWMNFYNGAPIFWLQRGLSFGLFLWLVISIQSNVESMQRLNFASDDDFLNKIIITLALIYSGYVVFVEMSAVMHWVSRKSRLFHYTQKSAFGGVPIMLYGIYLMWDEAPLLKDIILFAGMIWLGAFSGMFGLADARMGYSPKYLAEGEDDYIQRSFRSVVGAVALIFMLVLVSNAYARYVYPHLPQSLGGAGARSAVIVVDSANIKGSVIELGPDWVHIVSSDEKVTQLNTVEINRIEWKKD